MDQRSIDRLAKVHPRLSAQVPLVIEDLAKQGYRFEVGQGLRTFAEQDALYAQGRTMPGDRVTKARGGLSDHNYGFAVDLVLFVNGKPNWLNERAYDSIGPAARRHKLLCGDIWPNFQDRPHIYLPGAPSVHESLPIFRAGGLAAVWSRIR